MARQPRESIGRSRGHSAGLSRAIILDAARTIPEDQLTMKAVADELGVNRKALNWHFPDRQSLVRHLASDTFAGHLAETFIDPQSTWQQAVGDLAHGMDASLAAIGALASEIRFGAMITSENLDPIDRVIAKLETAGFSHVQIGSSLAALAHLCIGVARDRRDAEADGAVPDITRLHDAVDAAVPTRFPAVRRLLKAGNPSLGQAQLDASVRLLVDGMSATLESAQHDR